MTIFDHINSILFTKKQDNLKNVDDESTFLPFMLNRWISMYSTDLAKIINETTNRYYNIFSKSEFNSFLTTIIPYSRFKRISYIKKTKKEVDEEDDKKIELIAKNRECSQREVRELVAFEETINK